MLVGVPLASLALSRPLPAANHASLALSRPLPAAAPAGLAPVARRAAGVRHVFAAGERIQYCSQIPIVRGTPPWGFHTGPPITGATGSYARGHGNIDLQRNTVSGILCQVDRLRRQPDRLIIMRVEHHLLYHSHHARRQGVEGNIMIIKVRVTQSTDPRCRVGTVGRVVLFASYNGVRRDSVSFAFPAACRDHDHTYRGAAVNAQVPPL